MLLSIVVVTLSVIGIVEVAGSSGDNEEYQACPGQCACLGNAVDCSKRKLRNIPLDIPTWTEVLDVSWNGISQLGDQVLSGLDSLVEIDLSHNEVSIVGADFFKHASNLQIIKLSYNNLARIPRTSVARSMPAAAAGSNLSHLILSHNSIHNIDPVALGHVTSSLRVLDLGFNVISNVRNGSFPSMTSLRHLLLNDNRIELIDRGVFDNMTSLEVLKLNKNKLHSLLPAVFNRLDKLRHLELSGNRLRRIEGLRFQGLSSLTTLRLRRNALVELMDGAFWGLSAIETLQLDHNNLTRVHGGFLFGLETLKRLHLSHNKISTVESDSWPACKQLTELDLSQNRLSAVTDSTFSKLSSVVELRLSHNRIAYIAENAFRELTALKILELDNNELSGILDDSVGVFTTLTSLTQLSLSTNGIKSITKKAFDGLSSLQQLYLLDNDVTSIQDNAFSPLKNLQEIRLNTSSLLCDCHLSWLSTWLRATGFNLAVNVRCGHPVATRGRSVLDLAIDQYSCDDFPKPVITRQPMSQIALKDGSLNLTCQAVTSSDSPLTISWKKDHTVLTKSLSESSERRRSEAEGGLMELTSSLRLWPVKADHAGVYQCIASNTFGTAYSVRAAITISVFPRLVKTPTDSTVRAGTTARLECAAVGQPTPEVAWQKDGGYDFPAARERRMHVMPSDDVFFIVDVKTDDQGVYTCTAKNDAGSVKTNATLTVIQAPSFVKTTREKLVREGDTVVLECMSQSTGSARTRVEWLKDGRPIPADSPRHHMAADSQILLVTLAQSNDAGIYTCVVSNSLGSERAVSKLTVVSANGNKVGDDSNLNSLEGALSTSDRHDVTVRIGFAVMAGVAGVVLTSFIWVLVIYCLRRRRDTSDSSSSSSSTSDTIVVGAGTSSDLSYCTMKLKGSMSSAGYNISPVSTWIYDRNNHVLNTGGDMKQLAPSSGRFPVATRLCSDDVGCACYCDHQHVYERQLSHSSTLSTSHLQRKRHSVGGSSDLSDHYRPSSSSSHNAMCSDSNGIVILQCDVTVDRTNDVIPDTCKNTVNLDSTTATDCSASCRTSNIESNPSIVHQPTLLSVDRQIDSSTESTAPV